MFREPELRIGIALFRRLAQRDDPAIVIPPIGGALDTVVFRYGLNVCFVSHKQSSWLWF